MGLVTLEMAKDHLKPPGNVDDDRISKIIGQATGIILDHLKLPFDAYQSSDGEPIEGEVPGAVEAATLLVIGALYDNADGQDPDKDPLSPAVLSLLRPRRTPTLA